MASPRCCTRDNLLHPAPSRLRINARLAKLRPLMDPALDYLPRLPRRKDFRIGCIGAGFIMRDCHLPAYRQAGFNPVAIASRDPAHARDVAKAHGLARSYAHSAELLA